MSNYKFVKNINYNPESTGIIDLISPVTIVCFCDEEQSKFILEALNKPNLQDVLAEILSHKIEGNTTWIQTELVQVAKIKEVFAKYGVSEETKF